MDAFIALRIKLNQYTVFSFHEDFFLLRNNTTYVVGLRLNFRALS